MLWLMPHLFADPRLLDVALPGLRLPGLATLFARGRPARTDAPGLEGALARACGLARQQDWPLASQLLAAEGIADDDAYWLRADPAHCLAMRDRIVLAATPLADLSADEARELTQALAAHFGPTLAPLAVHPQRWYLRLAEHPQLITVPPSLARGRPLHGVLPHGADARRWRARLNEAQMLLHAHPLNAAREAGGRLPVNALWLWGGGVATRPAWPAPTVYAESAAAAQLVRACGAECRMLPTGWTPAGLPGNSVLLFEQLTPAAESGDALAWREALKRLEVSVFAPLAHGLRSLRRTSVTLADPISGVGVQLQGTDGWRFWRRPRPLAETLSSGGFGMKDSPAGDSSSLRAPQ